MRATPTRGAARRIVGPTARRTLAIALADLLLRWPNDVAPYTRHMYALLGDPDARVRAAALTVLSHLLLNSMIKPKGHVVRVCLCFHDPDEQVRARPLTALVACPRARLSQCPNRFCCCSPSTSSSTSFTHPAGAALARCNWRTASRSPPPSGH